MAIKKLSSLKYLKPELKLISNYENILNYQGKNFILDLSKGKRFQSDTSKLNTKIILSIKILKSIVNDENENSINIKLAKYHNFSDLITDLSDINKIFSSNFLSDWLYQAEITQDQIAEKQRAYPTK